MSTMSSSRDDSATTSMTNVVVKKRRRPAGSFAATTNDGANCREGTPTTTTTGRSTKGKFNVPVDPDEPTYCSCEQVKMCVSILTLTTICRDVGKLDLRHVYYDILTLKFSMRNQLNVCRHISPITTFFVLYLWGYLL